MPASSESLSKALAAMSGYFVGDATLLETLQKVADLACATLPNAAMVGLTLLVDGRADTAVCTHEAASKIDSAQYATGAGPCLDAFRHLQVYRIDDLENDRQWPVSSRAARAHGMRSSMSVPLLARRESLGALNFYSRTVAGFSDDDVQVGLQFATHAAIVLANTRAYWDAHQLGQDLASAMEARAVVEQAKGILMGTRRCSAYEAFQILVRASQQENRKVREIATEMVVRTVGDPEAHDRRMFRGK